MASNELVPLERQVLSTKDAIAMLQTADLPDVIEIHDRAIAAEAYAKVKQHREAYLAAGEIKLWAERSAGELRRRFPKPQQGGAFDREEARRLREQGFSQLAVADRMGVSKTAIGKAERRGWVAAPKQAFCKNVPLMEFDESLGVASITALMWERLALIPEQTFAELVSSSKDRDAALTARAILRRYSGEGRVRVEPGIYRQPDGRLAIKWQKDRVQRFVTLPHGDLAMARKALARARGTIKEPKLRTPHTVGDSYALVRRALQTLDRLEEDMEPDTKRAVRAAMAHLHKAEDELVIASQLAGRRAA